MNLPNKLTVFRIALVPIMICFLLCECIPYHYLIASVIFALASITDFFDGQIARKRNLVTSFGKFADPLADKITQIATISALILKGIIPFWILVIITTKELIMISVAFVLYKKHDRKGVFFCCKNIYKYVRI